MANIKFLWDSFWDDYTITVSTEHENFPATNTQHRDFNKAWRSQYGAGSGWGRFGVTTGVNDAIDFEETNGVELNATLTPAAYNADTLAAEIETQLEAAGGSDYTVTYSDSTNKFTIASDGAGGGGLLKLLWDSGTNTATSVGDDIGFGVSADDTGALTYTADEMRIHLSEFLRMDFGSAQNCYGAIVRGHNLQGTAQAYIQFSADNFATIAAAETFTTQDNILVYEWDVAHTYRYARIEILDVDNPDDYVKVGRIYIGGQFQPVRNFRYGKGVTRMDGSMVIDSADGQKTSLQRSHYDVHSYSFPVTTSAEKANFDAMFVSRGLSKGLFVIEDPDLPLTTTYYGQIASWQWTALDYGNDYWNLTLEIEELR